MTPKQFTYWLQGYAELNDAPPNAEQWKSIREHLALVFNKVTPPFVHRSPSQLEEWRGSPVRWDKMNTAAAPPDLSTRVTC